PQLNIPVLGDRRDARGETARQPDQHILDGRRSLVLGGKDLRMVGIELEGGLAVLLLAQTVEALDSRMAVRAVFPFRGRTPLEPRGHRGAGKGLARAEQGFDVDAVVDPLAVGHDAPPVSVLSKRMEKENIKS